jgi:glycosyltransferase involved in cell wall biosynthesis
VPASVHVTLDPPERISGKAKSTANLVRWLELHEHPVRFVHPLPDGPLRFTVRGSAALVGRAHRRLGKALYYRLYRPPSLPARIRAAIGALGEAGEPVLVHAHDYRSALAARSADPDVPLVLAVHGFGAFADELADELYTRSGSALYRMVRSEETRAIAMADRLVAPTAAARTALLSAFPAVEEARVSVVPNVFSPNLSPVAPTRARLGIPEDACLVVTVGQVKHVRRMDLLLGAAAVVRERVPGLRWVVVGDGPERKMLEARARSLGLAKTVHFTGFTPTPGDWVALADVVASTAIRESFGGGLVEAAMQARPLVAFDVGGVSEIVRDGDNGFLVAPMDTAGLAERVVLLAGDRGLRDRMGASSARRAGAFGADRLGEANLAIYRELCTPL